MRARPLRFVVLVVGLMIVHVVLPPIVLSVARKPADYFAVNPWLPNLPAFLGAPEPPWSQKLEKIWNLAVLWTSASNPYGAEWGFAIDVADLTRIAVTSVLIALFFSLWSRRRALEARRPRIPTSDATSGPSGVPGGLGPSTGALGAVASVLGLTSGPCTVMGCGAPVIPVIALAFAGLSSGTLQWLARASTWATTGVLLGLGAGVVWLGWVTGSPNPRDGPSVPNRARSR